MTAITSRRGKETTGSDAGSGRVKREVTMRFVLFAQRTSRFQKEGQMICRVMVTPRCVEDQLSLLLLRLILQHYVPRSIFTLDG